MKTQHQKAFEAASRSGGQSNVSKLIATTLKKIVKPINVKEKRE